MTICCLTRLHSCAALILSSITIACFSVQSKTQQLLHTPSIAFRHLPPLKEGCRKPVLGVCSCCRCNGPQGPAEHCYGQLHIESYIHRMGGLRVRSFLTTLPHGQPHPVFRGLTPFLEGGWEEAEDSPGITMQHTLNINISLQAWCSCWCQCHVTHPSQGDSREPLTPSFGDRTLLHCLLPEIRVALHGQGTEAARSALPILISVCSIFLRPFSLSGFGIFNKHTDVDACGCTRGLYGHRKTVCTGS